MSTRSRPTIRQVAKLCGVSAMTVSAVLNNKPGQMSAETRERVLKVVREVGYRPTPARWIPEKRDILTLGVISGVSGPSLKTSEYYGATLNSIMAAADQEGHSITVFASNLLQMDPHRGIRDYCDDRCDGLLVIAPHVHSPLVRALRERGFPFVAVGDTTTYDDVSFVDVDNVAEGYATTRYLLSQGHRRIMHLRGPDFVHSACQRLEGYERALQEHNIPVNQRFIVHQDNYRQGLTALMQLPASERPTALFAWHDDLAVRAIEFLQTQGISVPDDLSVIGFNGLEDSPMSSFLTTVRQPFQQIAHRAVEILIAQCQEEVKTPQREFLPTELVVHSSVKPFEG